ncbi:MAG: hypothetical protein ACYDH9_12185 [Limisphaerales bacterium]
MNRVLFLLLTIVASGYAQSPAHSLTEEEFFVRFLFPKAREFARIPGLPFPSGLNTNLVKLWKIDRVADQGARTLGKIYLTNGISIWLHINNTNCVVSSFTDSKAFRVAIRGWNDPAEARFLATQRDYFTERTALEFATAFLEAAGNKPENFKLVTAGRYGAIGLKTVESPLPFYEYEWVPKDAKKVKPGQVVYPHVDILVAGMTRTVVNYDRLYLPVTGDSDSEGSETHPSPADR